MGLLDDPMSAMMLGAMGGFGGASPMAAGGNPFGSPAGGGSSLSRNLMQMRAMRYLHEPMTRPMRAPGQGRGAGMMGGQQDTPDYSQFTFDPAARAAASQYLGQYGLSPLDPSQVRQNTILPNSGFFGNHPRLSGALEGGIYGAAASRGAETWGEGITNVANSLIAGPQMRAAAYNRQFERPFQAAQMLESLKDKEQKGELTSAQIEHYRASTQALKDKPDPLHHAATGLSANDSAYITYDSQNNPTIHENPYFDKTSGTKSTPGIAPIYRYARQLGITDPDNATPQQWKKINALAEQEAVNVASARTGADTEARIRKEYKLGEKVPVDVRSAATQASKDWWDPKNKEIRSSIQKQSILGGSNKFLSEDEINQQINQHNMQVNEKIHGIYQDFLNAQQSPMPSAPAR